jgi:hypothetical protein
VLSNEICNRHLQGTPQPGIDHLDLPFTLKVNRRLRQTQQLTTGNGHHLATLFSDLVCSRGN